MWSRWVRWINLSCVYFEMQPAFFVLLSWPRGTIMCDSVHNMSNKIHSDSIQRLTRCPKKFAYPIIFTKLCFDMHWNILLAMCGKMFHLYIHIKLVTVVVRKFSAILFVAAARHQSRSCVRGRFALPMFTHANVWERRDGPLSTAASHFFISTKICKQTVNGSK